jgi:predicted permease
VKFPRLRARLHRRRLERDLDDELAFHRALLAEKGAVHRRFGNEVRLREATREQWMMGWLEALTRDLRLAVRGLRRAPGFSLTAILILALGIGANSTIFGLAYGILWRPLPYPDAHRIVEVRQAHGAYIDMMNSGYDLQQARGVDTGLVDWAQYRAESATLTGAGPAEMLYGVEVESSLLHLLRPPLLAGRLLQPADDGEGKPPVVDVSEGLWRAHWGADPAIVGKPILLDGKLYLVAGVIGGGFGFPNADPQFTSAPIAYWRNWKEAIEPPGNRDVAAVARLAPGITLAQARQRLGLEMKRLAAAHSVDKDWSFEVTALRTHMVQRAAGELWVLLALSSVLLLIAAANFACLLAARAERRRPELAARAALGASRLQISRLLLSEALCLIAAGGAAALGIAGVGLAWLQAAAWLQLPRLDGVGLNGSVIAFTTLIMAGIALAFAWLPGWRISRAQAPLAPRPGGVAGSSGWTVVQVAAALVLLTGAGVLALALQRMLAVPLGFHPDQVLTFGLSLPEPAYPAVSDRRRFYARLEQQLAALPGVTAAAVASGIPTAGQSSTGYVLPGIPLRPGLDQWIGFNRVSAAYFETLGIPVIAGRGFHDSDTATAPPVAVVSAATGRRLFHGANPIGRRIRLNFRNEPWRTIVGVVGDVQGRMTVRPDEPAPLVYVPLAQSWAPDYVLVTLRAAAGAPPLLAPARRLLTGLDSALPIIQPQWLRAAVFEATAEPRFRAFLALAFGGLALLLTGVGIYGVMSYRVQGRTREFAVRSALGARPAQVRTLVLRGTATLLAAGLLLGLLAAAVATRLLANLLFGVSPLDPRVLAAACGLLLSAGLLAAWLPARRAMRVDAAGALRRE